MSSNDRPSVTDYSHPADDPAQIEAMRMAIALGDNAIARSIAADVIAARIAWQRERHPTGRGACPEDDPACCDECAAAYSAADPRDNEESEAT